MRAFTFDFDQIWKAAEIADEEDGWESFVLEIGEDELDACEILLVLVGDGLLRGRDHFEFERRFPAIARELWRVAELEDSDRVRRLRRMYRWTEESRAERGSPA